MKIDKPKRFLTKPAANWWDSLTQELIPVEFLENIARPRVDAVRPVNTRVIKQRVAVES